MVLSTMGLVLVALGLVVRTVLPRRQRSQESAVVLARGGTLTAGIGVAMFVASAVVLVDVGEVGVKHFLGRVHPEPLQPGVHIINPFASVEKMSVREQSYPGDNGVERMEAQTSEQLNVALEVSLLYRINGTAAPVLFQRIGSEEQIKNRIVLNAVRNGVRDAIATKSINEVFSPNRRDLAVVMKEEIQAKAGDRIEVLDVFVRDIQAPPRVKEAIEAKLQREQQVAAEKFQTEIIQERARQQVEEARGIAEAQRIINEGLTDRYLTLRYIEALEKLPEGSLVIAPADGGTPVLVNPGVRR